MPRIADVLDRESRTVDLEQGDFERLLGRRERKQRDRRIRAGALGVIVALATAAVLARSLTSAEVPADPPVEPRPAPAAPGTLAYILDGDIFVADQDGSNAVKIADGIPAEDCDGTGEFWAEGSMWSPDGRYLAYRHHTDCSTGGGRDVVISDAEGNVLATFPAQGWDIAWSPDSTRVAVWDPSYDLFAAIGVYGLDGARQTQLSMPPGWTPSGDHDPEWMPDGTSLRIENWELPLDGSTPRPIPWLWLATYSPDGSRVAYIDGNSLVVAVVDGSEARYPLQGGTGTWDPAPAWSPTGDRIAFISGRGTELSLLDVATGEVTPLAGVGGSDEIFNIQFAPEGDRILFARTGDRGAGESLWSINVDGTDARLVVAEAWQGDWLSR